MRMQVPIKPFTTPNFVILDIPERSKQAGFQELQCLPIKDVDVETLDKLCQDFREAVFTKAGKPDPSKIV